jgi:hypothetical protein
LFIADILGKETMPQRTKVCLMLVLVAGLPRLLAAFSLPNTFGDAYVYIRDIGTLSTKLKAGVFAITDLYGFWLPLYQFISAVINVFAGNGFYVGKVVSAIFGAGVCLFVYEITLHLVQRRHAALLAFALIALNPVHTLTSSSALTDVPHGFFVLVSVYFVLKRSWIVAAIFAALASLTRVESWMFIALIPLIQFFKERRISFPAVLIMLAPPIFWFYVSWKAAGDWLACFKSRQQYLEWLMTQNPALAQFSFFGVSKDSAVFINSIGIAVLCAAFIAGWFVVKLLIRRTRTEREPENVKAIVPLLVFFFAFFALLVIAYVTHQQPIIFPRYGLILFSLGIPILAWTYLRLVNGNTRRARRLLISVIVICVIEASVQVVGSVGFLNQISAQRAMADYLRDHFDPKSNTRIFCDEGTVTVMSGIPAEKFLTSADAPREREAFLAFLREKNVEYLVFVRRDDSTPAKLFPDLDYGDRLGAFEPIFQSQSRFLPMHIWLYRVHARGL